jgi:hypothetical protein
MLVAFWHTNTLFLGKANDCRVKVTSSYEPVAVNLFLGEELKRDAYGEPLWKCFAATPLMRHGL